MREIKFRAWSKAAKEIIDGVGFHPFICQVEEGYRQGEEGRLTISPLFENYILMQYTGLKDKNGKEIYEGDIAETIYRDNLPHKGIIYFQPTRLNWSVKHSGFTNQDLFVYSRPDCSVEIVGNIYENPELLK